MRQFGLALAALAVFGFAAAPAEAKVCAHRHWVKPHTNRAGHHFKGHWSCAAVHAHHG